MGSKIRLLGLRCTAIAATLAFVGQPIALSAGVRNGFYQGDVHQSVADLWSSDEESRLTAKTRLISLGQQAIPPLVTLLEEILANPYEYRFMTERVSAGLEAIERYHEVAATGKDNEAAAALKKFFEFEITARLKLDAFDILGQLHAEQAVPVLCRLMQYELNVGGFGLGEILPEMRALLQIGPAAVPKLIESIEGADETAAAQTATLILTKDQKRVYANCLKFLIQKRAVIVLGHIGDARALPKLYEILAETSNEALFLTVEKAIERIADR